MQTRDLRICPGPHTIHVIRHPWFQSITRHLTIPTSSAEDLKSPFFGQRPPKRPFAEFDIHCCSRTVYRTGRGAALLGRKITHAEFRDIYDSSSLTGCCRHLSRPRVASMTVEKDDGNSTLSSPRPLEATAVDFRDEKSVNNRPSLQQDL